MRFAAPGYLWFLLALPILGAGFALSFRLRRRALETFGDPALMRRLSTSAGTERRVHKAALVVTAALFLVLALARPQWGARLETVTRRGVDVIVAVDTSLSMLAEDVKPNRLAQAHSAVQTIIDLFQGDRVGLVAFAGTAYVACPLTLDASATSLFVDLLDPDLLPVPGTAIAEAIKTSIRAFPQSERRNRVIILITDGEDHEGDVESAARAAAEEGITIYTLGIGGTGGEPIPLRNARGDVVGYKEDREHRKVTSRLGEGALQAIATTTGGKYYRSSAEGSELKQIQEEVSEMDQGSMTSRHHVAMEERYTLPLGVAILLMMLEAFLSDRKREAGRTPALSEENVA
jgi:Ca-activated chloride channel homolog